MALAGGMSAPWLFGRISQSYGIGAGFWITVGSCAAIIVLQLLIRATGQRRCGSASDPTAHPGHRNR
jgi:isoaspartyl peptidase/L-asparaginase-like protein (Ntn-hydrolase superfamily)